MRMAAGVVLISLLLPSLTQAIELNGSAYSVDDAPMAAQRHAEGEKIVVVDPREHAWGAYDARGRLIRWGIATAGADYCSDVGKPCRTKTGNFRIYSQGSAGCISNSYPFPGGGAPMPYCMYFTASQAIHGSNEVVYENASHGCVRVHVDDAKWLRYQFVEGPTLANNFRGTKIVVMEYN